MPSQRDNFTVDTIRRAASRVGYRCSFPGCSCATVGPSMENNVKISTLGVAAHICAAAENGPRYDSNMTTEERRSIDNCIWLCQTHAKLIDTDVSKYTVEVLHSWKKEAEKNAATALADANLFNNHYDLYGDNLDYLETLFEGFIFEGDFDKLIGILTRYSNNLNDYYNELVLRYKIIFDCYCSRDKLEGDIEKYTKLPCKNGINQILKHLISFNLQEGISALVEFCDDTEIVSIANSVLSSNFIEKLFIRNKTDKPFKCSKNLVGTVNKFLANYLFERKFISMKDQDGNLIQLYDSEFLYKIKSMIFELMRKSANSYVFGSEDFEPFKYQLNKIKALDLVLKKTLLSSLLTVFIKSKTIYLEILSYCDDETKQSYEIKGINYIYKIINEPYDLNPDEIIAFCDLVKDYKYIEMYSSTLTPDEEIRFIEEHQYLYRKSCYFIYRMYVLGSDEIKKSLTHKISELSTIYENNFDFKCIKLLINTEDDQQELDWLSKNLNIATSDGIMLYIDVLSKYNKYTELYDLSKIIFNSYVIYCIAKKIQQSGQKDQANKCKELYTTLLNNGYAEEGLLFNLSLVQKELGELENAKVSIKKEYQLYHNENALFEYLCLRYTTNEFKDDEFLLKAKNSKNASLLNLVGATLQQLHKFGEAFKYCMRSLLTDKENIQCLRGMFAICSNLSESSSNLTNENNVIILKNPQRTVRIAIYEPSIIEGLSPNDFADCMHFSSDNPTISQLLFSNVGEEIELWGEKFTIEEKKPLITFVSRVSLASIIEDPTTIKISGETPTEVINTITEFLKQSSEDTERIITEYNNATIRYPLSFLAKIKGKSLLNTQEFLIHGNTEKIRNNVNVLNIERESTNIILSYDSIVILSKLGMLKEISESYRLICPPYVAEKMQMEIKKELSELADEKTKGNMLYKDGGITLVEYDPQSRAIRHRYLTELKSFIDSVTLGERLDYIASNDDISSLFSNGDLGCEKSCLGIAKDLENSILLTDDQFLYAVAQTENIKTVGLLCLICGNQKSIKMLVDNSKKLIGVNFAQYLSLEIYNQAVDIIKDDSDSKTLREFLLFDKDNEETTDYHSNLIINLYKDFVTQNDDQIIYRDAFYNIAILHLVKLHPEILSNREKTLGKIIDLPPINE